MDSSKGEIEFEFPPFIRVYKDGHAERIFISQFISPSVDPSTGVSSKDVTIKPETGLSARLYLPKVDGNHKLPLLIYIHGGGFCIGSAFSPLYHSYINSLVAKASVVVVSVEYRTCPDHPLPVAYEDSWAAVQWTLSKQEEWLSKYANFDRVFMAGDSAGANIAHNMAIRAGTSSDELVKIDGIVLIHPYFSGSEPIGAEVGLGSQAIEMGRKFWRVLCPTTTGMDDPLLNPGKDQNLSRLGCKRVLVCVAEKDGLRDRGKSYYETLGKSGWNGVVELMEAQGETHVFHLLNPACQNAMDLMNRVALFINASK